MIISDVKQRYGVTAALMLFLLSAAAPLAAQEGHQHHGHGGKIPAMDADGRRLDPNASAHEMSDEQLAGLRKKVALYRALTDREARMNMAMMGPNYEWYISDPKMHGDTGVLVLSHGVGENSDRLLVKALKPLAAKYPSAVAFGMAMMMSSQIQSSVDDLTAHGAKKIVLVPTGLTEYNSLTRHWKYIFGMYDEASYLDVPKVKSDAQFIMTRHFDDHPLITEILLDYTLEKSKDQPNEVVIIVGHGPEDVEDNKLDLAILQKHVDRIKERTNFADVKIINLQDDALPPIRKSNVKKLRRWINSAKRRGQTVIVTVASSASFGVQQHILEDLRGLDYEFADKGFNEHPNYIKWINAAVAESLQAAN